MSGKVDHKEARKFAEQILRYPAPLDRAKIELLARAYVELAGNPSDNKDCVCRPGDRCMEHGSMTDEEANRAQDEWGDAMDQEFEKISKKFGVSSNCAANIWYLRTRSRWSQEAEDELIRMDKAGEGQPNINEWP